MPKHDHGTGGHEHGVPAGRGHRRPLTIVLAISSTILVVEVVGAVVSGSLALLADAGHMLTDVAGLALALVAAVLVDRPATDARTWGYRRAEVLAAAAQAAVLLAVGGFVLVEGVRRLLEPPQVASGARCEPAAPWTRSTTSSHGIGSLSWLLTGCAITDASLRPART